MNIYVMVINYGIKIMKLKCEHFNFNVVLGNKKFLFCFI